MQQQKKIRFFKITNFFSLGSYYHGIVIVVYSWSIFLLRSQIELKKNVVDSSLQSLR